MIQAKRENNPKTAWGEVCLSGTLLLLAFSLTMEFCYNFFCVFTFLLRRQGWRRRVRKIMFHGSQPGCSPPCAPILVVGLALLPILTGLTGCAGEVRKGSPGSFQRQIHDTAWSTRTLVNQSDAKGSMEQDLRWMKTDPDWVEELRFSVVGLGSMKGSKKSMEWTLQAMKDDPENGVAQTIHLFGW